MGLYDDLIQNHDAKLIAGGAAQNTARGAQVRLRYPNKPYLSYSKTEANFGNDSISFPRNRLSI